MDTHKTDLGRLSVCGFCPNEREKETLRRENEIMKKELRMFLVYQETALRMSNSTCIKLDHLNKKTVKIHNSTRSLERQNKELQTKLALTQVERAAET